MKRAHFCVPRQTSDDVAQASARFTCFGGILIHAVVGAVVIVSVFYLKEKSNESVCLFVFGGRGFAPQTSFIIKTYALP